MKVIDLLNKIANGEITPEKIKYNEKIYHYGYHYQWYLTDNLCEELFIDKNHLNDEIEIIEDTPKEDKKIKRIEERESGWWSNMADGNVSTLKQAINEIIDRLNGEDE